MATGHEFEFVSHLPGVRREAVWARISTPEGVNHELAPFVRMTFPTRFSRLEDIPADSKSHFTSFLLALGFLPLDVHRFALRGLLAPEFFDEVSSNLMMRRWAHRRTVSAVSDGVEVRDVCRFEARIPGVGRVLARAYRAVFAWRHRRLRAYFDGQATRSSNVIVARRGAAR